MAKIKTDIRPLPKVATGGESIIRRCSGLASCCVWQPSSFMSGLTICRGGRASGELLDQAKRYSTVFGVQPKLARTIRWFSSGRDSKALAKRVSSPRAQSSLATISQFLGRFAGIPGIILSKTAHSSNYWCRLVVWTTDRAH